MKFAEVSPDLGPEEGVTHLRVQATCHRIERW